MSAVTWRGIELCIRLPVATQDDWRAGGKTLVKVIVQKLIDPGCLREPGTHVGIDPSIRIL